MGWLQSILYAFVSGLAEFLPISAPAHGSLLSFMFGVDTVNPVFKLFMHLGILAAVAYASKDSLHRFRVERAMNRRSARKKTTFINEQVKTESSLVRTGSITMLVACFFYLPMHRWSSVINISAAFLLVNGILLFVAAHIPRRQKDVRAMSPLDGFLVGLSAWLAVFSGISRVGVTTTTASLRGASMSNSYKWSLLISIPALIAIIVFDFIVLFTDGMGDMSFGMLLKSILGAGFAFAGAVLAIQAVRSLLQKGEFSGFAFYCWGAALFLFILFLI